MKKNKTLKEVKNITLIIIAAVIFAFNIKSLVHARGLLPGGLTGVTLLIQEIASRFFGLHIPYTPINLILNAIPIYIGFRFIGKKFTIYSCLMIVSAGLLTDIVPMIPITYDILLISIFGGIINGVVVSMCLFADATSGGLDFISIFLSERYGIDAWNYILAINAGILLIAGSLFGWQQALYSLIFQMVSTEVLHMGYKRYQKNTLLIITDYPEEVSKVIKDTVNHGSTLFNGAGTYEMQERHMIYSVVSSDEVKHVLAEIHKIDPNAFVNVIKTENVNGNFYQRPQE